MASSATASEVELRCGKLLFTPLCPQLWGAVGALAPNKQRCPAIASVPTAVGTRCRAADRGTRCRLARGKYVARTPLTYIERFFRENVTDPSNFYALFLLLRLGVVVLKLCETSSSTSVLEGCGLKGPVASRTVRGVSSSFRVCTSGQQSSSQAEEKSALRRLFFVWVFAFFWMAA